MIFAKFVEEQTKQWRRDIENSIQKVETLVDVMTEFRLIYIRFLPAVEKTPIGS